MAVVAIKSAALTNRDATPKVLNNPNAGNAGIVRNTFGRVTSTSGDSTGSVYRCVEVPSNARVKSVRLFTTALGGSAAADIGVYRNTADGGAVVTAAVFATATTLVSAVAGTEMAATITIAKREQPLWQAAGMSADPGGTLDIALTLTAASAASTDVGLDVDYVL